MPNDKVIISQSILNDIANAVKTKTGMREQEKIKPINMANTISSISTELHLPITVNIVQSEHQTITVTPVNINNSSVSGTTVTPPTTVTLNATIVASEGYIAGTLNQSSVTANWGDTVMFSATPAVAIFNFTLPATTNQTITLSYTEPGESLVTRTSTSTVQVINMKYGTTWNATVTGADGYNPGTLSISSGTVNGNISITVTEATVQIYEVDCSVMISGVAQNYPNGVVDNNNYRTIADYFKTDPGSYLKSDWLSIRGYSNIENDKYSSYTNINYSPNQFLIYYQYDAPYDLGYKESLTVDSLNSDGYYDSSTGYIHVKNNKYNPIIIRQLFGVEVRYVEPRIAQNDNSIKIYNYDFNNRILSLNSDTDNPDGTIMLLRCQSYSSVQPTSDYIYNHIYIPPDNWTNNYDIERYLFNFTYEDTVTETVYSNTTGKKNTDRTYANLSDGPVYDIEMFGFRVFHVEDNESYQDYYDQLSRVAYDSNNLPSTCFIIYNQNNPKLRPDIVQENFRMLIYKQLVDQMYPYINNSGPNNPLFNTPINFKLIFN